MNTSRQHKHTHSWGPVVEEALRSFAYVNEEILHRKNTPLQAQVQYSKYYLLIKNTEALATKCISSKVLHSLCRIPVSAIILLDDYY